MKNISIAIDGPSSSGKSTVAKALAKKFNLIYVNTGLVYRAIALNAKNLGVSFEDVKGIVGTLKKDMIDLHKDEVVFLKGKNVTKILRADDISQGASKVSTIPDVRTYAVKVQQDAAKGRPSIMDGRDTTFKVLPNADLKIFLDATPKVQAQRRVKQNKELGFDINYDEVFQEIKERDFRDRNRKIDPLHKTKDAILIDSSNKSILEVISIISKLAKEKM